jgi:transcriptional regulator with XRE-family HTH domain
LKSKKLKIGECVKISGIFDKKKFAALLKVKRIESSITKKQLGSYIGRSLMQIQRYEDINGDQQQYPSLEVFVELCTILQINPLEILNIKISNSDELIPEQLIKEFIVYKDRMHWTCIKCGGKNSDYDDYRKLNVKQIVEKKFACEHCGYYHDGVLSETIKENTKIKR